MSYRRIFKYEVELFEDGTLRETFADDAGNVQLSPAGDVQGGMFWRSVPAGFIGKAAIAIAFGDAFEQATDWLDGLTKAYGRMRREQKKKE